MKPGQKVVIIEDLVSTGSSSLKAVRAVRQIGSHVLGMVAIFTYDFPQSAENFRKEGVELITLSRYQVLIGQALASGKITEEQLEKLMLWREDPANWGR